MAITPNNENIIGINGIEEITYPNKSWLINPDTKSLELSNDDGKLMKQALDIRLRLERFAFPIFTERAGMMTVDLPGRDLGIIVSELKKRIEACLKVDDRVISISDFKYEQIDKESILVTFTANTLYGDFEEEMEYSI